MVRQKVIAGGLIFMKGQCRKSLLFAKGYGDFRVFRRFGLTGQPPAFTQLAVGEDVAVGRRHGNLSRHDADAALSAAPLAAAGHGKARSLSLDGLIDLNPGRNGHDGFAALLLPAVTVGLRAGCTVMGSAKHVGIGPDVKDQAHRFGRRQDGVSIHGDADGLTGLRFSYSIGLGRYGNVTARFVTARNAAALLPADELKLLKDVCFKSHEAGIGQGIEQERIHDVAVLFITIKLTADGLA